MDATERAEVLGVASQAPRLGREESLSWVGWQSASLGALRHSSSGTSRIKWGGRVRTWVRYLKPGQFCVPSHQHMPHGPEHPGQGPDSGHVEGGWEMTVYFLCGLHTQFRGGERHLVSHLLKPSWLIRIQRLVLRKLSPVFILKCEGSWFSPPPLFLLSPTLRVDSCPWFWISSNEAHSLTPTFFKLVSVNEGGEEGEGGEPGAQSHCWRGVSEYK